MIALHKLEIFNVTARSSSFSAAAEQLYISQAAVSQHIHDLEVQLGTPLFKRHRRGVLLTDAGKRLYEYTQQIFQLVSEAEAAVADIQHLTSGQTVLGATPGIGVYLLPECIQSFRTRYPALTIALHTGITAQMVTGVLTQRLEIAFIEGELDEPPPRIVVEVLREVEQFIVVGQKHAWWQTPEIALAELQTQALILRPAESHSRIWFDGILRRAQLQPHIAAEIDNLESIKRAIVAGVGVAVLPRYAIQSEEELHLLHAVRVHDVLLQRSLKLIYEHGTVFAPVTRAFIQHVRQNWAKMG